MYSGLIERGFKQSELDPCLFLKKNMMCVVYVDNTIIASPDPASIDSLITSLGIAEEEYRQTFDLRDEGEVGDFLGIRIEKAGPRKLVLSQTGLIAKVLKEVGMEDCNPAKTPTATNPLHKDEDCDIFQ